MAVARAGLTPAAPIPEAGAPGAWPGPVGVRPGLGVRFFLWWALLWLACQPGLAASSVVSKAGLQWVPAFSAPLMAPSSFDPAAGDAALRMTDLSLRQFVPVTLPGRGHAAAPRLRLKLSNEFGDEPLVIDEIQLAWRAARGGVKVQAHSERRVHFSGQRSVRIDPGQTMLSDPVDMARPSVARPHRPDLAISLYLAQRSPRVSWHPVGSRSSYRSTVGRHLTAAPFPVARTERSLYFLAAVDVAAVPPLPKVWVAFGDSITDGAWHRSDADNSWPLRWRQAWLARPGLPAVVLNAGLSGNRLLTPLDGPSGSARFERDVLALPQVGGVVLQMGINDLGSAAHGADLGALADAVISAQSELMRRARARGIKVVGATLTPIRGGMHDRAGVEAARQAVNAWIRQRAGFDAVVDFDAVVRDPARPDRFRAGWSRDALHPTDLAYGAMAAALVRVLDLAGLTPVDPGTR